MRRCLAAALPAAAILLRAVPAEAHIVASRLGDFYAGALHPLSGLEDVILWVALGVLAGTQPERRARWLVPLFPLGLLAGLLLGLGFGVTADPILPGAAMMVTIGGLLAAAFRLPAPLLYTVGLALALLRGAANASGVAPDTDRILFAAGFVAAGYSVITLAAAATSAFQRPIPGWRDVTIRALGSWIAAIGLMLGGFALRGLV